MHHLSTVPAIPDAFIRDELSKGVRTQPLMRRYRNTDRLYSGSTEHSHEIVLISCLKCSTGRLAAISATEAERQSLFHTFANVQGRHQDGGQCLNEGLQAFLLFQALHGTAHFVYL